MILDGTTKCFRKKKDGSERRRLKPGLLGTMHWLFAPVYLCTKFGINVRSEYTFASARKPSTKCVTPAIVDVPIVVHASVLYHFTIFVLVKVDFYRHGNL